MATDGPTPPPCDLEIWTHGECLIVLDGPSNAVERWVTQVALEADARVDWHLVTGLARVLHLGDTTSRARVQAAIDLLLPMWTGGVLRRVP